MYLCIPVKKVSEIEKLENGSFKIEVPYKHTKNYYVGESEVPKIAINYLEYYTEKFDIQEITSSNEVDRFFINL